jgi:flavin-dependent dehydrogenase
MSPLDLLRPRYDVVVVGARAAGAATAMLLARGGLRVLAVDRGAYGTDTLSTHALMRAGVAQLSRWGLLDAIERAGTPRVSRTVFHYDDAVVDVPISPRPGVPALFAPRRMLLDRVLVDGAMESGAYVIHGVRLVDVLRGASGRVAGVVLKDREDAGRTVTVRAGLVVGADGLRSTTAELVGAPFTRTGSHATATLYGYWAGLELGGYQWYWTQGAAAGAIPTNGGLTLLFASVPARAFAKELGTDAGACYRRVLERAAPGLAHGLGRARLAAPLSGFAGMRGFLRRSWGPGWALVGDAGSFKDPITAHGISDALRDAELLSRAVLRFDEAALADYEAERDALSEGLFDLTDRIASFAWDAREVKELHRALSDEMKREVEAIAGWDRARRGLALAS